jgi:hypothetical protein
MDMVEGDPQCLHVFPIKNILLYDNYLSKNSTSLEYPVILLADNNSFV